VKFIPRAADCAILDKTEQIGSVLELTERRDIMVM